MSALKRWEPTTRWNPFKELEEYGETTLGVLWAYTNSRRQRQEGSHLGCRMGTVGGHLGSEKEYVIKAELPEMKKEEIKINVHDDVLAISGERK